MKIFILLTALFFTGIDNFLFNNKELCENCVREIEVKKTAKEGECYSCKGRYGDRPGNKYFLVRTIDDSAGSKMLFEQENGSDKKEFSLKQKYIIKSQKGMDENEVKRYVQMFT